MTIEYPRCEDIEEELIIMQGLTEESREFQNEFWQMVDELKKEGIPLITVYNEVYEVLKNEAR